MFFPIYFQVGYVIEKMIVMMAIHQVTKEIVHLAAVQINSSV